MRANHFGFAFLLVAVVGTTAAGQAEPQRFHFSFKTPVAKEPRLRMFNLGTGRSTEPDAEGLTLSVLPTVTTAVTYGVQSKMKLKGDFEITLAYERFAATEPYPKYGGGINITIELDREPPVGAAVGRNRRPEGDRFGVTDIKTNDKGKKDFNPTLIPAEHPSGKLRLARTGDRVRMLTADGDGEFKQYRESRSGKEDVTMIQFQCYRTDKGGSVSVRLREVTIVADEIVGLNAGPKQVETTATGSVAPEAEGTPEKPTSRKWVWIAIVGVILVGAMAVVLLMRRK